MDPELETGAQEGMHIGGWLIMLCGGGGGGGAGDGRAVAGAWTIGS